MHEPHRTTSNGSIDYDFYKAGAARLRAKARSRVMRLIARRIVAAICAPWRACRALARSWQATWPSRSTAQAEPSLANDRRVETSKPSTDRRQAA
jgi:hypothetical protein